MAEKPGYNIIQDVTFEISLRASVADAITNRSQHVSTFAFAAILFFFIATR